VSGKTRRLFAIRDFRLFLVARVFSSLAMPMLMVALGWTIYDMTRNPFHLGMVGLSLFLPQFLLTLPAGHLVDRFDRRLIAVIAMSVLTLSALCLTLFTLAGLHDPVPFFAVMLVFASANALIRPTLVSLLPQLVPKEDLASAVALNSSTWQMAGTTGPAVGGLLYGLGAPVVFCTVTGLFAIATFFLLRLSPRPPVGMPQGGMMERLLAGVHFVRQRPILLGALTLDLFAVLFGGATALLPVFARDILDAGPFGLGLLRSAPAVGAVACGLYLTQRPLKRHVGKIMFAGVAGFGVTTILFGLSRSLPLSLGALLMMGIFDMLNIYVRQNLVQLNTPDAMRGRVSAVTMVFVGASNELGEFESGVTAAWFGTVPAVVLGGVGSLLVVLVWAAIFKSLRQADRLDMGA
jgi:MFS family permease